MTVTASYYGRVIFYSRIFSFLKCDFSGQIRITSKANFFARHQLVLHKSTNSVQGGRKKGSP